MIPLFKVFMAPEAIDNIKQVFNSGMIAQGPIVEEYEKQLKLFIGNNRLLSLNSATSGLTLALRMLNLSKDTIVLSTPLTCTATNWPILANGLRICWVDVDSTTCNMDLNDLESKLNEKTRVVMFVHWGGYPIDLDKLEDIKDNYKKKYNQELYIIEDCAHAFGAIYKYDKIGNSKKNICVFSTQAIKHLTTIDGGFITLPTDDLYNRAKKLRWFGIDRNQRTTPGGDFRLEPDIEEWGYKYNMNDVNASVGLANLKYMDSNIEHIQSIANYYNTQLDGVPGVELLNTTYGSIPSYWIYTIKIVDKNNFIKYMKENNVMCSQVHHRNDVHTCVSEFKSPKDSLSQLDSLVEKMVCIPCGWWVSISDADYIVKLIRAWCEKKTPRVVELVLNDTGDCDSVEDFMSVLTQLNKQSFNHYTQIAFKQKYDMLRSLGQVVYVAKIENTIVGTAKLLVEPKFFDPVGHIEDVVVDVNFRHMGIGKLLVQKLCDIAFSNGCYKVVLCVNPDMDNFYKKNNFKHDIYNTSIVHRMFK